MAKVITGLSKAQPSCVMFHFLLLSSAIPFAELHYPIQPNALHAHFFEIALVSEGRKNPEMDKKLNIKIFFKTIMKKNSKHKYQP